MKIKKIILSILSFSIILIACNDDEMTLTSNCDLPYEDLELIGESELSPEIVQENYQNFDNIDSLNAFTLELCDLGRHLVVQIVSTVSEYNFTIYDSCSVNIASGMFIQNDQLENDFEESIENELNKNITILDLSEINFSDGVIRYIVEINEDGEEPRYLLKANGEIICKLF